MSGSQAKTTIEKLDLNINKLRKMREAAMEGILNDIELLRDRDLEKLIAAFEKPNQNGKYEEFCHVIIYVLKQYLSS